MRVAIVGGGISGLTAGIYAQKAGFQAEIYEKNAIVGGECTGWDRGGYHIDNCIHWLMGTTGGTGLNKIWRDIGAVGDGVEIIRSDKMYRSELNGQQITLWKDIDRTERELLALSPEDAVEIKKLMGSARAAEHVEIPADVPPELMGPLDLVKLVGSTKAALKLFREYEGVDTNDLMARFKHPLIRCVISDFCTRESMAHSFPMAYGNFVSGDGGIPRGGSRAMALRIQKVFEQLGGKVYTNAPVTEIELDGTRASGPRFADGRTVQADYIICACDPDYTFSHLLNASYLDPILKAVYSNREAYPIYGMFQVAFAVDSDRDALEGEVILDCSDIRVADWMNDRMTVKSYAYEPSFAPKGKQIVQVLLGLREEAYDYFAALYQDQDAYRAMKADLADRVRLKIEQRFPEYQGKMTVLDTWTPVTYKRYCNAFKGYNQAFVITKNSAKNPYPSAYIKGIDNVILAGQWLSPPGGLPGAAIQGRYAVQRILKKEKRKIKI